MEANTKQLESIFDPNVLFQVPLFQRPYVWTKDENWEPLWEDIVSLLDRHLRLGQVKAHFMGAIVLEQLPHPAGSIETRLVIDGQQRFTTLQIMLIAARNISQSNKADRYQDRFTGLIENDASRIDKPYERYKLWPTNGDREAFKLIHKSRSLQEVNAGVQDQPALAASALIGAYRYFHEHLATWLSGALDDADDHATLVGKTFADRLETLWRVVERGLQLVVINLDQNDETQVIFETLNFRGTELLPADLIKNYLFRKAAAEPGAGPEQVEDLYTQHWAQFETPFWRTEIKQGRIKRPRIDLFISHYLTLMVRDEVKAAHLFNAFKLFAENTDAIEEGGISVPHTPAEHLARLARYAVVLSKFYEPGAHTALALFLRRLEAVDTSTVYPFLLHAYSELMPHNQPEFDAVLGVLEAFLMRRLIMNYTSKNYNRLFVDLIRSVAGADEITAAGVGSKLAKATGESNKFPTNAEVLGVISSQPLYGRLAQYKVRAVLEALNASAYSNKSEALAVPENLTIEHVLPQSWLTHWPLAPEVMADPLGAAKAAGRRNLLLQTLGNLTLINGSLNSAQSNSAWALKRPELIKFSRMNLTAYFHEQRADHWNEDAIEARTKHLGEQLLRIWPEPVAEALA